MAPPFHEMSRREALGRITQVGAALTILEKLTACRPQHAPAPTEFPVPPTIAPSATGVELVPTAQPTATGEVLPTAQLTDEERIAKATQELLQTMDTARSEGKESFSMDDFNGIKVVVDVAPSEMLEGASWDWNYRAFTRVDENGIRAGEAPDCRTPKKHAGDRPAGQRE